jgi:hypothetical protein
LLNGIPSSATLLGLLTDSHFTFSTAQRASPMHLYLEGLNVLGGMNGVVVASANTQKLYFTAKNCQFLHGGYGPAGAAASSLKNGLNIQGNVDSCCESVTVAHSALDGFNYHAASGYLCRGVEINCRSHDTGTGDVSVAGGVTAIQNGTTTHDGARSSGSVGAIGHRSARLSRTYNQGRSL